MADRDPHPIEAIHALVDGALAADERAGVERHLEGCEACRAERELAEGARRIVRQALAVPNLPPGLETRIDAALDAEAGPAERGHRGWPGWLAPGMLVAVVALLAFLVFSPDRREEIPLRETIIEAVAQDFGAVQDGSLPLSLAGADPEALEAFFEDQGIDFETRVFDLGMMGFEISGGRIQTLAGRPSALFAYVGPDGVLMVCRMYLGNLDELPEPISRLEHEGIVFHVYERDGRTLVFWEEGDVVCVLASDAPAQDVIDLALAKAVKI